MNARELAKIVLTDDEYSKIEFDLPQFFVTDCENLLNIDARQYYVWYFDSAIGRPLNIAELYVKRYLGVNAIHGNIIDELEEDELQRKILGSKRGE